MYVSQCEVPLPHQLKMEQQRLVGQRVPSMGPHFMFVEMGMALPANTSMWKKLYQYRLQVMCSAALYMVRTSSTPP